jgi:hypothetical protein
MKNHSISFAALALVALSVSCGGDPIIGRWKADIRSSFGIGAAALQSADATAEFRGDHTGSITSVLVYNSNSPVNAGCTQTVVQSGIGWTTSMSNGVNTLATTASSSATTMRTGCANPANNQATTASNDSMAAASTSNYTIMGNQMILTTNGQSLTFVRQ